MDERGQEVSVQVPLEFHTPEDVVSRYATHLVVQHTEHELIVSFFEAHPPALLGSPEEIKAELGRMSSVRADCVARIVVAAGRMPEFVQVLRDNLEKYLTSRKTE